jgi:hypothetical protein
MRFAVVSWPAKSSRTQLATASSSVTAPSASAAMNMLSTSSRGARRRSAAMTRR